MMSDFRVISAGLNLRSSAEVAPGNIIRGLPQGQIVTRIGSESDSEKWWQVRTILDGNTLEGFVSKSFLVSSSVLKQGISTNKNMSTYLACLKTNGIDFIFRYYSTTTKQPEKRLTISEAKAISAAGVEIVTVYEDGPTTLSYFSKNRGQKDGKNAHQYARAIGQPSGSAIYFAIDYDASKSDISSNIYEYFLGVDEGMRDASGGSSIYTIGVYASGAACSWLKSRCPFIKYTWLAESTAWLESKNYTEWAVKQFVSKRSFCNLNKDQYEECTAQGDF